MTASRKVGQSGGVGNRGQGRKKGVPNKTTAMMKDAIMAVYADLQAQAEGGGAHGHFLQWAADNATEFYKIASKLIPIQVAGDPDNPLQSAVTITFRKTDAPRGD